MQAAIPNFGLELLAHPGSLEFATLSFVDCEGTETRRVVVTSIHSFIAGLPEKRLTGLR